MKNLVKLSWIIGLVSLVGAALVGCKDTVNGLPALSGTVSIDGIAQVGQTLTANTGKLGGSGIISFQWMRSGNVVE